MELVWGGLAVISVKLNLFSNVLSMNNDVRLLMPEKIQKNEKLRCLWLCHGGSGDENDWLYYSNAAQIPNREHMAVIIVNANDSCFADMAYGLRYTTYIGMELQEILTSMFPHLSTRREDNYISGLSNGGYGSFLIGLTYPERFAAIGAFSAGDKADSRYSPSAQGEMSSRIRMFGADEIHGTRYSIRQLAKNVSEHSALKPRIYHACGSLDPWLDMNLLVRDTFEKLNDPAYDYTYDQMDGYGHEWPFWDAELQQFLEYIRS